MKIEKDYIFTQDDVGLYATMSDVDSKKAPSTVKIETVNSKDYNPIKTSKDGEAWLTLNKYGKWNNYEITEILEKEKYPEEFL